MLRSPIPYHDGTDLPPCRPIPYHDGTDLPSPPLPLHGVCSPIPNHDGTDCFRWDKTLWSQQAHFKYRWELFKSIRAAIDKNEGGLQKFAQGERGVGCCATMRELRSALLQLRFSRCGDPL